MGETVVTGRHLKGGSRLGLRLWSLRLKEGGVTAAGPRWLEIGSAVLPASGVKMWSFGGGVRLEALVAAMFFGGGSFR